MKTGLDYDRACGAADGFASHGSRGAHLAPGDAGTAGDRNSRASTEAARIIKENRRPTDAGNLPEFSASGHSPR